MRALLIVGLLIGFAGNNAYANDDDFKKIIGIIGGIADAIIDSDKDQNVPPGYYKPGPKPPYKPKPPFKPGPKPPHPGYGDQEGQAMLQYFGGSFVLGRVFLERGHDTDVIHLPRCQQSANKFVGQVRLVVPRDSANINSVRVVFQNNRWQDLRIRPNYRPGSATRWIDLQGPFDARCIKRIHISGRSLNPGPKPAVVRVEAR